MAGVSWCRGKVWSFRAPLSSRGLNRSLSRLGKAEEEEATGMLDRGSRVESGEIEREKK